MSNYNKGDERQAQMQQFLSAKAELTLLRTENGKLRDENERLEAQVSEMEVDLQNLLSYTHDLSASLPTK
ncbi:MAG: hypothetical protein ACPGED_03365 [Flavobacteriales bacterium]